MKISHFISGGITEVVQGLLQAQKAVALYGVELKTTGGSTGFESLTDQTSTGSGFSELDFDLAVTTRTDHDGAGDVELSVLGVDLKLAKDKDVSKSTVSRMKFSVQFSIPQEQLQKVAKEEEGSATKR